MRYELYCLADPLFYDSPVGPRTESVGYEVTGRPAPPGWRRITRGDWVALAPCDDLGSPHGPPPRQGWKIHVSATLDTAEETLQEVWDYCVPRLVSFKFLRAPHVLHTRNAKYACRESSGKLVTIYPEDEARLATILTELDRVLGGRPGPYLLGGLRWADGPLYVRYGGFVPRYGLFDRGVWEPAIEDPDGRLVPDRQTESFSPPPWVRLPAVLEPHLETGRFPTTTPMPPFLVERVLHLSNGGGVYAARDTRSGEAVVVKEARPHAGLTLDAADAVARLAHERSIMESLTGLAAVPAVRGYFTVGQRTYLVRDFVEGVTLDERLRERYPLSDPTAGAEQATEYTKWALRMYGRVEEAVTEVHRRGVVFGDLHPFNVIVRPDDSVALVDFEAAAHVGEPGAPDLAHPGFAAPQDRTGFERDRYALACLRLAVFLPLTSMLVLQRSKAAHFAEIIAAHFPVPAGFLDEAVAQIHPADAAAPGPAGGGHPTLVPDAAGWERARASLTAAILASATPDRADRLFPGDIEHFRTGGLNIAYGAAGVLYALDATGAGRYPAFESWLARQALSPPEDARLGFYDGLHGVAYVLEHLCRRDEAMKIIEACMGREWEQLGLDLGSGLSGIALNLRHLARQVGEPVLYDAAVRAADMVADRLGAEDDMADADGAGHPYAGLFDGSSGPALLFIRMFEDSGDPGWLDRAAEALGQDLRRCVAGPDGTTLYVNEGTRTVPYLNRGSAGIAVVLDEYLAHRVDERFSAASAAIRRGVRLPFVTQPGLFNGRAGIIAYLAGRYQPGRAWADRDVSLQVRNLAWHALSYRGHLAFPGDHLYRLSMDLATGAAGVLLALGAALHDDPVALPLLERDSARPR
ncbi:MAG TPA: class III lanthionine synthetase LanKC [Streptosporangiaceae bacterium]|nr:class III lanthionine synthetase LanKC [Streptosporangiaceae bacterium]